MDRIFFNRMAFYAYHGAYPEENRLGQRFFVDLELGLDLAPAARQDDLNRTVDYGKVYEMVKKETEAGPYALVETLAERIAQRLLETFSLQEVKVRITKPDPPIPGHYDSVGVEITRRRPHD
ncbi:MAG: dihydroneopterin aldolase [Firmicutes bacterium]|uniref:7,8-dihydroneopterin aldolase n=1 Tax=Melghirimyces thermohalophilus TaxID=1236220 RepID=A0A1G6Q533_9BACL|nr:dihydroneopterin aldolase [Melghirimyces thermohalophilus]MDA8352112.1 dihydroneopterin aldolase [Bacillota bacterium]SDC86735.1 dihydroneopterin aldolase [Melghirimyces thermohalophilus]